MQICCLLISFTAFRYIHVQCNYMFLFVLVVFGSILPRWLLVQWCCGKKFKWDAQNLRYNFFIVEYIEYFYYSGYYRMECKTDCKIMTQ